MDNLAEFYKLASPESAIRIQAAQALSEALNPPTASNESTPDQAYAFTRLTKGLASGRESARLGFTLALAEVYTSSF
jgi:DNA polymerase phi